MVSRNSEPQMSDEGNRISKMEFELQSRLAPVSPDPEFIRTLHSRLTTPSTMHLEPETPMGDLLIALAISGGGIILLVVVLRVLYEILKVLGIIRSSIDREDAD